MAYVVEMTGYDPVATTEKTLLFAMGRGIAFTDATYAEGTLKSWQASSQKVGFAANGSVQMSGDGGQLVLQNLPDDVTQAGPLDYMLKWIWQNRKVTVYSVPGRLWSERVRVGGGVLEQPVSNLSIGSGVSSTITFPIRDPRASLETPLQPSKYLGTNVGPVGVEGGEALKGRPKPVLYGLVSNLTPVLVNESLLIYQISDAAATILCVRDGGVSLTNNVGRASMAAMQANTPPSGRYDTLAGVGGTYIRLGSTPIFKLTVDADEATNEGNQSHPYIWDRFRVQRLGKPIVNASRDAAYALDSAGAGFFWDNEITQRDALDEILGSFSGFEFQDAAGTWQIRKLVIPTGTPVVELEQLTPTSVQSAKTRAIRSMSLARPSYRPDGAPPYRVTVRWGRNYTLMGPSDFAGVAPTRLKEKFAVEYRETFAVDNAIWNPVTKTGPWTNAPELMVDTAYQPGAGGIDSPGANAEATRLLTLFKADRNQFQCQFVPETADDLFPGDVIRITYPRADLSAGALFTVLEAGSSIANDERVMNLVVGLQA